MSVITAVRRAKASDDQGKLAWYLASAVLTGLGLWGAHFIFMLAYEAPVPIQYDLAQTLGALAVAILVSGGGWAYALEKQGLIGSIIGGLIVGLGLSAMHFMAINAMEMGASVTWDVGGVMMGLVIGLIFCVASTIITVRYQSALANFAAVIFLVLGLAGLYFPAMTALIVTPIEPLAQAYAGVPPKFLALLIALGTVVFISLGLAAALFDSHLGGRKSAEISRFRVMANATFEGLIIVRDNEVIELNTCFAEIMRQTEDILLGLSLSDLAYNEESRQVLESADQLGPQSARLINSDGLVISVRVLARDVDFGGVPARVLAIRDVSFEEDAKKKMYHMAHHDALTGLPNRSRFRDCLEAELKKAWNEDTEVAVMAFDLDRFKEVNDVHGHATGDALLIAVAERFIEALPENAIASRLSGDEFAVLIPGITGRLQAASIAQHVVNKIGTPVDFGRVHLNVSASGGVTIFPQDGESAERLMHQADLALYRAKSQGRNCVCEFDSELGALTQKKRQLETDLTAVLDSNLLELHFQPQANLDTGEIVGFEALVRWNDEKRGYVPPDEFVRLAEETGQILKIGQWVLDQACFEAVKWPGAQRVAVNVSPAQFKQGNLVHCVQQALKASGLEPSRLELEITEGVLIDDGERALKILRHLRDLGVSISIDDFGTGYASLNYLRAFPFNMVKIDRTFMDGIHNDPEAQIIVNSTIRLAQDLGMEIVIEGVESFEELSVLRGQKNLMMQGYLLSRPLSRGQIPDFLQSSQDLRNQIAQTMIPAHERLLSKM